MANGWNGSQWMKAIPTTNALCCSGYGRHSSRKHHRSSHLFYESGKTTLRASDPVPQLSELAVFPSPSNRMSCWICFWCVACVFPQLRPPTMRVGGLLLEDCDLEIVSVVANAWLRVKDMDPSIGTVKRPRVRLREVCEFMWSRSGTRVLVGFELAEQDMACADKGPPLCVVMWSSRHTSSRWLVGRIVFRGIQRTDTRKLHGQRECCDVFAFHEVGPSGCSL